jgi:hypothetical protein
MPQEGKDSTLTGNSGVWWYQFLELTDFLVVTVRISKPALTVLYGEGLGWDGIR